jgi:hypothetical protein
MANEPKPAGPKRWVRWLRTLVLIALGIVAILIWRSYYPNTADSVVNWAIWIWITITVIINAANNPNAR